MKALEKDRARRYGTPSELSADLQYLRSEPVAAGPATAGYRLRKYALRHRFGLVTAVAVVMLLAGSVGVQAFQLHRTRLERDRANRERDRANRITDFMTGMFKLSDPGEARGNSVAVREILDKASADIDTSLTKDPELQAQMMFTMAGVYDNLGLYRRAQSLYERALELCRRTFGPEDDQTLKTMQNLAVVMAHQGHYDQTERWNRQLFDIQRRTRGPEDPRTLVSMSNLAVVLHQQGRYAEATQLNRPLLDIQRRVLGPEHRNTVRTIANLAAVLIDQGQFAEAEKLDREALAIQQKAFGPDNPDAIRTMSWLAIVLYNQQKYADAEKWNRRPSRASAGWTCPEHPWTLLAIHYGRDSGRRGQIRRCRKMYRQALDIQQRLLGKEHPDTLRTMANLVLVLASDTGTTRRKRWTRAPSPSSAECSTPSIRTRVHLQPRVRHGSARQQGRGAVALAAGCGERSPATDRCEHGQGFGTGAAAGRRPFRGARRSCQRGRRRSPEAQSSV